MVGRFVEVCRRRDLKVNADKSMRMVLSEEERLECQIIVDGNYWSMCQNISTWVIF